VVLYRSEEYAMVHVRGTAGVLVAMSEVVVPMVREVLVAIPSSGVVVAAESDVSDGVDAAVEVALFVTSIRVVDVLITMDGVVVSVVMERVVVASVVVAFDVTTENVDVAPISGLLAIVESLLDDTVWAVITVAIPRMAKIPVVADIK
jgi:hypothetical protein